ncbi:hypothetical protein BATDEDRAFT_89680 [Batrachochytrium dendrobatidis JAM81]|uniref:Uncharacterized protein n=2 Tax=Batrachochytrium dendrobatidis TaxID=109871 RepID=F4P6G5_BATDJ|nr:uncharacterized protein BATDEDRAFT_89680 [Batrachochytrium dendrobatidis JAM81]EGF79346.1 hypothetical protein BATDEDRAFT_89680 [Batrachochytrium dendrobatidis JAM81]OAJ42521.1 hypothetical protein BDEG_25973 [Batrachochytrium dendrobatidis JEL423]|eukprot:XP_006680110.1 hypothetical protein BATDEDRAFT_89680 [Batrachochytrium dendrobatidis JAM81]
MAEPATRPTVSYKILTFEEYNGIKDMIPIIAESSSISTKWNGTALDLNDGFIHLSTQAQALPTVDRFFSTLSQVILLEVNLVQLSGDSLRWELAPSVQKGCMDAGMGVKDATIAATFPHIHGGLDLKAVVRVLVVERQMGKDGLHETWKSVWPLH